MILEKLKIIYRDRRILTVVVTFTCLFILTLILLLFAPVKKNISVKEYNLKTEPEITPVIAKDTDEFSIEEFNSKEKNREFKYTLESGEEVKIFLPEGIDPPPLNVVEELNKQRKNR